MARDPIVMLERPEGWRAEAGDKVLYWEPDGVPQRGVYRGLHGGPWHQVESLDPPRPGYVLRVRRRYLYPLTETNTYLWLLHCPVSMFEDPEFARRWWHPLGDAFEWLYAHDAAPLRERLEVGDAAAK